MLAALPLIACLAALPLRACGVNAAHSLFGGTAVACGGAAAWSLPGGDAAVFLVTGPAAVPL